MNVSVFTSFCQIPRHLAERCSYPNQPNFMLSLDWFRCLHETTFPHNHQLRAYFVTDHDDEPKAALFCVTDSGSRCLRSLTNFYTTCYAPILLDEKFPVETAARCLADHITAEIPRWRSVELRLIRRDDQFAQGLVRCLQNGGFHVYQYPLYANWYRSVDGLSFQEFYASVPSKTRNTIKRKQKKLLCGHHINVRLFQQAYNCLDSGMQDYVSIYNRSWKQPEPHPDFMPRLARLCSSHGILLLGVLYIDEMPAAAQFWIVTPPSALIYKLAYVEEFAAMSPGSILSRHLFQVAIDQCKPAEIDYGVGDEGYKRDWMTECRSLVGIHGYNKRTAVGLLLVLGYYIKGFAKWFLATFRVK